MNSLNTEQKLSLLNSLNKQLKENFFGLDQQIDQIIKTLVPWVIDPDILDRPLIINLWGMTGTGKTEMVRYIYNFFKNNHLCEFPLPFLDFDCRKLDFNRNLADPKTLGNLENKQCMILFDEFQFTRSIDNSGKDVNPAGHDLLWNFFNDGFISTKTESWASSDMDKKLLEAIFGKKDKDYKLKIPDHVVLDLLEKYQINPADLQETITNYDGLELFVELKDLITLNVEIGTRYNLKKALVFVSGNIDEAFTKHLREVDSDALTPDELYEETKEVTVSDIKSALFHRFRAEQIARLGHNHIIFPSINEASYRKIIKKSLNKISNYFKEKSGQEVIILPSVENFIFEHGAIASQGTRNLLSFIDSCIQSRISPLSLEIKMKKLTNCEIGCQEKKIVLNGITPDGQMYTYQENIEGLSSRDELHDDEDYQSLVAYHEAGHAIVGYKLSGKPPELIRSKTSNSGTGGFVKHPKANIRTKQFYKNRLASALGGYLAEKMMFGEDNVSSGCSSDVYNATSIASMMVRELNMGKHISNSSQSPFNNSSTKSFKKEDDEMIEDLLKEAELRAEECLVTYKEMFLALAEVLKVKTKITKEEFLKVVQPFEVVTLNVKVEDNFNPETHAESSSEVAAINKERGTHE